ncbi:hypothetical protein BC943DRAFT_319083 [Umbelopsis sp. AD052]|nr:hypothetical protein BC943DRAFT_319083 [Umbelopsis sp. AD052]
MMTMIEKDCGYMTWTIPSIVILLLDEICCFKKSASLHASHGVTNSDLKFRLEFRCELMKY